LPDPNEIALRALSHRDVSRSVLARRLAAAGVENPGATVDRLTAAGLVDDRRRAELRAAALAERGLGDAAIEASLETDGIGRDDRLAALATIEQEEARARRLAREGDWPEPSRLAALLARRGFTEDAVEAALAALGGPPGAELG
jgi:SOS response regulatory protein OraA/RecX